MKRPVKSSKSTHGYRTGTTARGLATVLGLHGKVLVAAGVIRVASMRSCEKLPTCLIKPVLAGPKTDPPLPKAKTSSDGGSASLITYLRKGRKNLCRRNSRGERGVRRCQRNNSADTKVSEGGGKRCSKCRSREPSLAACDEVHGEAACSPAVHGSPRWSRYPPVACGRDPTPE